MEPHRDDALELAATSAELLFRRSGGFVSGDDSDNIITLPFDQIDAALPGDRPCGHWQKFVDAEKRVVICRHCSEEVNAFDELLHLVRKLKLEQGQVGRTRDELNDLHAQMEKLKLQERRIKGRIRNANSKDAVEQERARLLNELGTAVDRLIDHDDKTIRDGRYIWALERVCDALFPCARSRQFKHKLTAAQRELDARAARRRIQVVPRPTDRQSDAGEG